MPIIGLLNVSIERLVYRPLRNAPRLAPLITAIGVSFILQNVALILAGSGDRPRAPDLPAELADPDRGASISVLSIFIFVLALFLMVPPALRSRTRLGRAMRATAQDREAASLMGVDMNQTIALTFLLGGALAARPASSGAFASATSVGPRLQRRPQGVHRGRPRRHRSLVAGLVAYLAFHNVILAILPALLGYHIPRIVLRRKGQARLKAFEAQFAEAIDLLVGRSEPVMDSFRVWIRWPIKLVIQFDLN